ncbi:MAG: hypothetical protein M1371_05000 [Actinobacteria bacterium]|nr:hypothetical protein [Actinomycetota bacterium]
MQRKPVFVSLITLVLLSLVLMGGCSFSFLPPGDEDYGEPQAKSVEPEVSVIEIDETRFDPIFIYPDSRILDAGVLESDPKGSYFVVMESGDEFEVIYNYYLGKKQQMEWRLFPIYKSGAASVGSVDEKDQGAGYLGGQTVIARFKYDSIYSDGTTLVEVVRKKGNLSRIKVVTWDLISSPF